MFPVRLVLLAEQEIIDDKIVHFSTHETTVRVVWCTNDGFATYIERCIDQDAAAGPSIERLQEIIVAWIGVVVNGLNACRVVDMGDRR